MMSVANLWLPVLLSAFGVFVASSVIHMVLQWHRADFKPLPNEDEVAGALRKAALPPGQYTLPYCSDMKQMRTPEAQKKFADGPVGFVVLRANGVPNMGRFLGLWFLLTLLVAAIAACLAATTLPVGASPQAVFHLAALVTFAAYSCGSLSDGIWMGRPRRAVLFDLLDALIYAAISGAVFAWLWPR